MPTIPITTKNQINAAVENFHLAAQFLAMLSNAYITKLDDDSHNNLLWDGQGLKGRQLDNKGNIYGRLNYTDFSISLNNSADEKIWEVSLSNKTWNEIYDNIKGELKSLGLDPSLYLPITHYKIPDYSLSIGATFSQPEEKIIQELINLRSNAQEVLTFFSERIQPGLEVRVWPHHFDSGAYGNLENSKDGIGLGWAMADTIHDVPYYYLSPYTPEKSINYREEQIWEGPGLFKQESFTGATLSIDNYLYLTADQKENLIFSFFDYGFRYLKQNMRS